MFRLLKTISAAVAVACIASAASAVTVSATFTKAGQGDTIGDTNSDGWIYVSGSNDCKGVFGSSFELCDVGHALTPSQDVSPIIVKFGFGEDSGINETEINSAFSSVSGSEFSVGGTTGADNSGTVTYNPDTDDPTWRYLVAKSGDTFTLFWNVEFPSDNCVAGDSASNYTLACLNEATALTSLDWYTATEGGVSHLSAYDTSPIPVPAAGFLMLGGLGGLLVLRRRRKA